MYASVYSPVIFSFPLFVFTLPSLFLLLGLNLLLLAHLDQHATKLTGCSGNDHTLALELLQSIDHTKDGHWVDDRACSRLVIDLIDKWIDEHGLVDKESKTTWSRMQEES